MWLWNESIEVVRQLMLACAQICNGVAFPACLVAAQSMVVQRQARTA